MNATTSFNYNCIYENGFSMPYIHMASVQELAQKKISILLFFLKKDIYIIYILLFYYYILYHYYFLLLLFSLYKNKIENIKISK